MENLEKDFMELIQHMWKYIGLEDLPIKVIAILYIEPEEISMDDVCKKTGYSLASISNTMKFLENMGIVNRIKKPKTKKVFFYMQKDIFSINIRKLKAIQEGPIQHYKDHMPQLISKYKSKIKTEQDKRKLKIIEDYYRQILQFETVTENWIKDLIKISESKG
jgi:HTH-type transcriptional regulator, osmoprotectant uptake regulator